MILAVQQFEIDPSNRDPLFSVCTNSHVARLGTKGRDGQLTSLSMPAGKKKVAKRWFKHIPSAIPSTHILQDTLEAEHRHESYRYR
jgi:hypothetical protein